ncbi:protein kinase domain-containing protein [Mycoplasma sp. P36-A1]|uniref:protein kinase domain-containing protein n=1 Tax=Mycoplasma sp. P36-A1 TaxID=3252900 RepID=UPI003C2D5692
MESIMFNNVKAKKKIVDNAGIYATLKLNNYKYMPKILEIKNEYVIYEYVEGMTLRELLSTNTTYNNRIEICLSIIKALKDLADLDLIHKDIKPENIIIANDLKNVYLIDFETTRSYDKEKNKDTVIIGTPYYASPEHYGFKQTTYKSDMYSLGLIFSEMNLPEEFTVLNNKAKEVDDTHRFADFQTMLTWYIRVYQEYQEKQDDIKLNSIKIIEEINKEEKNHYNDNTINTNHLSAKNKLNKKAITETINDIANQSASKLDFFNLDKNKKILKKNNSTIKPGSNQTTKKLDISITKVLDLFNDGLGYKKSKIIKWYIILMAVFALIMSVSDNLKNSHNFIESISYIIFNITCLTLLIVPLFNLVIITIKRLFKCKTGYENEYTKLMYGIAFVLVFTFIILMFTSTYYPQNTLQL